MNLGILITTCDADAKHFDRVLAEFTRLGYPFVVNFDHCSIETKQAFKGHKLYLAGYEDDDPEHRFDEKDRQRGLDLLVEHRFDWATYLDTDEVFDRRAPEVIPQIIGRRDVDMLWCPCIDFWGDDKHYRVDGPFGPSEDGVFPGKQLRNKFYNLRSGPWTYKHPDCHSPELAPRRRHRLRRAKADLYVLHYGIMNAEDVRIHTERWNRIYTQALGKNPHTGFYNYLNNPANEPKLLPFDYET